MPTYEYACTSCGEQLEVVQKFTDDPLTVCPACGSKLRKVFSPVGIVFKGSGFYRTDSRKSSVASEPSGSSTSGDSKTKANGSSDSSSSSDSSKSKPESKSAGGDSTSSGGRIETKKSSSKVSSPAST